MADRRMISKRIMHSARFLKMPITSQYLYVYLSLNADDDGIVEAFPIMRMIGANEDDLLILNSRGFIKILNEDLITYIVDWTMHNKIRRDRKIDSIYKDLLLEVVPEAEIISRNEPQDTPKKEVCQPSDNQMTTKRQTSDNQMSAQVRLGKVSIDKDNKDTKVSFCTELSCSVPEPAPKAVVKLLLNDKTFYSVTAGDVEHYKELYPGVDVLQELRNMVGWCESNPQKRKTCRGIKGFITRWLSREQDKCSKPTPKPSTVQQQPKTRFHNFEQRDTDYDALLHQMSREKAKARAENIS